MKRSIRLLIPTTLFLAVLVCAGATARTAYAQTVTFSDVAETHPAHDAIESLAIRGIVSGTGEGMFFPESPLTRGQASKILVCWSGRTPVREETFKEVVTEFPDVDTTFASYVSTAAVAGWVRGYPDGTFRPHDLLTRGQMAVVIVRASGLEEQAEGLSERQIALILGRFVDEDAVSLEVRPYMALAVGCGLFQGGDGYLNPWSMMTRAQFAMVLSRADDLAARLSTGDPAMVLMDDATAGALVDAHGGGEILGDKKDVADSVVDHSWEQPALAAFMDECLFRPHRSAVTGEMVLHNYEWYGIPPLSQLVIMAAETSLGDPQLGGTLARRNNFGCLRYHGVDTPWGLLADEKIWVAGLDWYSFPTPDTGMAAFGRYLKVGAGGYYFPILISPEPDWHRFATVYYGANVPGFDGYVSRLRSLEKSFRAAAARYGVSF
ncbi:MAG: S-layer homology domain-containing protein [Actinobacteria bacterium]|nr:S-layer homology domain-containing protein [Actinomycetota bacterium]